MLLFERAVVQVGLPPSALFLFLATWCGRPSGHSSLPPSPHPPQPAPGVSVVRDLVQRPFQATATLRCNVASCCILTPPAVVHRGRTRGTLGRPSVENEQRPPRPPTGATARCQPAQGGRAGYGQEGTVCRGETCPVFIEATLRCRGGVGWRTWCVVYMCVCVCIHECMHVCAPPSPIIAHPHNHHRSSVLGTAGRGGQGTGAAEGLLAAHRSKEGVDKCGRADG
jgi:hypothetical protein